MGTKQHTHFNDLIKTILLLYGSHKCASNVIGGGDSLKSRNERIHIFQMLCSSKLCPDCIGLFLFYSECGLRRLISTVSPPTFS